MADSPKFCTERGQGLLELTDRLVTPEQPVETGSPDAAMLADAQPDGRTRTADAADHLAEDPGRPSRTPDRKRPPDLDLTYWQQVEHLEAIWADHREKWPEAEKQLATDRARPDDPPGSWRGEGDRYLSPEENAESDRLIGLLREPAEVTTKTLVQIQQDNIYGGRLEGIDHRVKGADRLKEKIADGLVSEFGSSVTDAVAGISDAVRYTFSFQRDDYVSGTEDVCHRLRDAGYRMTYGKDHWLADPQYKGINTRWETTNGGRFELQFHTFESFHAKENLTHRSYDRLRSPDTSWDELPELEAYQRAVSGAIPQPRGIDGMRLGSERTP
jgi:hypothetical protein